MYMFVCNHVAIVGLANVLPAMNFTAMATQHCA
jgi:hypothetical protein